MDPQRRFFLRRVSGQAPAFSPDPAVGPSAPGAAPTPRRPPWALSPESDFTAACTRCGACQTACPHGLLVAGDGGFPALRFVHGGCDFCGACVRHCGPGALRPPPGTAATDPGPWPAQGALPGRVRLAAHCLALRQVECRLCGDACDTRALRFVPAPGGVSRVQLDPARCHGCGACLPPCPVGALDWAPPPAPPRPANV
ncbi:4Fe-4S dicluster domain-containing protein [Ideonella livida]|uniref:4Fe-4S dicluster domain-containing protein n=1 Tax=Ideonella livida TaxID=2707176 RepID=A0A7C9TKR0_9BURK|nr:4Fe-4S dicluster domain-containing protein [Ideonella livida]NDY91485.1 4Fe-4S dicluster domain-containing protein [Ideonella livida]